MNSQKFIIVRIGTFADSAGSGSYQIYEEVEPDVFAVAAHEENWPLHLASARERLAEWRRIGRGGAA